METHANHLHKAPGRKFRHYFFEFIMLFFAVFCGFLAEYQLEHKTAGEKEEQYIASMIEDLATDTTNLADVLNQFDTLKLKLDTLMAMYGKLSTGYNDTVRRTFTAATGFPDFIYSDRTMQQLKNSGGMLLIHSKAATDGIMAYDANVRDHDIDVGTLTEVFSHIRMVWFQLFDNEDLERDLKTKTIAELEKGNKNYLLLNDKATLGKLNNMLRDYGQNVDMVVRQERKLKQKAIDLIALLKKEYELK
jgi:hypothetical protein